MAEIRLTGNVLLGEYVGGAASVPTWITAPGNLATVNENSAVNTTVSATSSGGPVVYSIASGTLPGGITLNSATGQISGTAATVNSDTVFAFDVRATDDNGFADASFLITVLDIPINWVTPAGSLGSTPYNNPVNFTVQATGSGTITYSLASGTLPTGSTLNPNSGLISGPASMPVSDQLFSFSITATNGVSSVNRAFTITISSNRPPFWVTPAGQFGNYIGNESVSETLVAQDIESPFNPVTYSLINTSFQSLTVTGTASSSNMVGYPGPGPSFSVSGNNLSIAHETTGAMTTSTVLTGNFALQGSIPGSRTNNTHFGVSINTINVDTGLGGYNNSPNGNCGAYWFNIPVGTTGSTTIGFYHNTSLNPLNSTSTLNLLGTTTITLAANDVFTMLRLNSTLSVLHNGVTIYTFPSAVSTSPMYAVFGSGEIYAPYPSLTGYTIINDVKWGTPVLGNGLPNGLTLSTGGAITGTISASAGTYTFTIRASDSTTFTDRSFSIVVN